MRRLYICGMVLLTLAGNVRATPASDQDFVPSVLQPWTGWVLKGFDYRHCPFMATSSTVQRGSYLCGWPGRLHIIAGKLGAGFSQHWQVDAPTWVPLPGESLYWPLDVRVNGMPAVVLRRDEVPSLWLEAGSYRIDGRIPWDHRPQDISVPQVDALIELSVDGRPIPDPEREQDRLTLGRSATAERESLDVRVYRKLSDGVPAILDTRIQLDVNGQAREQVFGPVLPKDFVALNVSGELMARLDDDGRLHVQLQPGSWWLDIRARDTLPLASLTQRAIPAPWPAQEVWSYQSAPRLRVTSVHGAMPIDPVQADVPQNWQQFPAFIMNHGTSLSVTETSRGLPSTDSNRLSLSRVARLDFDGGGFYYTDNITGSMQRGWRLQVPAPYVLENAYQDGRALLVTKGSDAGETGIEVRDPSVNIQAGLRLPHSSSRLPVAGWREPFESVTTNLHLPYGYLLLGAPGADQAAGSWISLWNILDIFIVAVLGVLAFRLFGKLGGAITVGYLILAYHEPGAPVWPLALIIVLELACKWLPAGRLVQWTGWLSRAVLVIVVLVSLPFLAGQIRDAFYPQLQPSYEWGTGYLQTGTLLRSSGAPAVMKDMAVARLEANAPESVAPQGLVTTSLSGKIEVTGTRITTGDLVERYAPNTVIQAGEGAPAWTLGSDYQLSWNGPVSVGQSSRLIIAPPWLTRSLRVLLTALLAALIVMLARRRFERIAKLQLPKFRGTAVVAVVCLFAAGAWLPRAAYAQQFPSHELLDQLRTRLTQAPECLPQCAGIPQAQVYASGDGISLRMTVAAAQVVAVPVPTPGKSLALTSASLDGKVQDAALSQDGHVWVDVPRGVHLIELRYTAYADGKFALSFGLRPDHIDFSGSGWQADGISGHHLLTDSLGLLRTTTGKRQSVAATVQQFAPFVELTRTLTLNLDWNVCNQVRRIAPAQGGFSVNLPLLTHEHVLNGQYSVHDGVITIPVQNGSDSAAWCSAFDRSDSFTLSAPPMADHAEVWRVIVSPTWHAEFSGEPAVQPENEHDDFWVYEFHPLPGEKLSVHVTRPVPVSGSTLAINQVQLLSLIGDREQQTTLQLDMHATQAGEHTIELPSGAELLTVSKDNATLNIPLHDGQLVLPVTASNQQFQVAWRQSGGTGLVNRTPRVDVGAVAVNTSIEMRLPSSRWVLFSFGPRAGPAVLYWGELMVMILVAFAISRAVHSPLKFRHWLLLGLGFSTFSWLALVIVVVWILALQWRSTWQPAASEYYRLVQVLLLLLTAVALASIVSSIPLGLLGVPDMHITGNGSGPAAIKWFVDRSSSVLPQGTVVSLPMWCYRIAMLAWALWLAFALVSWLRWGFSAWSTGGYWPPPKKRPAPAADIKEKEATAK